MQRLGNDESRTAKCRVAARDGGSHHTQHGQCAAHESQPAAAHQVNHLWGSEVLGQGLAVGQLYLCHEVVDYLGIDNLFPAAIIEEIGRDGRPDERHDALGNHRAIEHRAGQALALEAARHQGALRGMETADGTTSDRDEHAGEDGILVQECGNAQHVLAVNDLAGSPLRHVAHVPQFGQVRHLDQQAHQQSGRHHQQGDGKQRIDTADDLVDGQQRGDHIVGKDDDDPHQGITPHARQDQRRAIDKHGTHHQQQQHGEHQHHVACAAAQVLADERRQVGAVVAQREHAAHEVVHRAGKDASQHNPQVAGRAKPHAHDGTKDGSRARNVQELDHEHLPGGQYHIIHAVGHPHGRCLAVVGAHHALHYRAVNQVAQHQGHKANHKTYHNE